MWLSGVAAFGNRLVEIFTSPLQHWLVGRSPLKCLVILSSCVVLPARTFHYTYLLTPPFVRKPDNGFVVLIKSPPPAERAAEIIDTQTGTAILSSGLLAAAISQELYVFNEETVIAAPF